LTKKRKHSEVLDASPESHERREELKDLDAKIRVTLEEIAKLEEIAARVRRLLESSEK